MEPRMIKTVTRTQGNNRALKDGRVTPNGFVFDFEEIPVLVKGFRRMVRGLEFEVCEMALTTYLCAREHGVGFTALPIFLVRDFHHGAIRINRNAGITHPKDLEGRRVGVNRGYTVTTGVWARAILAEEYGVDLSKITWVLSGDEHVASYRAPANVVPIGQGRIMEDDLASGALDAAIGVSVDHPDIVPLVPNALEAGFAAFRARGHYPINHLVVVRDDLLAERPDVAKAVFDAFAASKALYLDELRAGRITEPTAIDRLHQRMLDLGQDPLPYGIEPNRAVLETLVAHASAQGILRVPVTIDQVFAPATHGLTA